MRRSKRWTTPAAYGILSALLSLGRKVVSEPTEEGTAESVAQLPGDSVLSSHNPPASTSVLHLHQATSLTIFHFQDFPTSRSLPERAMKKQDFGDAVGNLTLWQGEAGDRIECQSMGHEWPGL